MNVIRVCNGECKEVPYPRRDISKPITGLEEGVVFYYIKENEKPTYDINKSRLIKKDILTDSKCHKYPHLLVCERIYEVVDFPMEYVVNMLKQSMEDHLTQQLPAIEQTRNITRYLTLREYQKEDRITEGQLRELSFLNELDKWDIELRNDLNNRILEYKENNIFPSFTGWSIKPEYYD